MSYDNALQRIKGDLRLVNEIGKEAEARPALVRVESYDVVADLARLYAKAASQGADLLIDDARLGRGLRLLSKAPDELFSVVPDVKRPTTSMTLAVSQRSSDGKYSRNS